MTEILDDSFQITLPSNVSSSDYPTNRPNNYTTKLSKALHLDPDQWECAIIDIQ